MKLASVKSPLFLLVVALFLGGGVANADEHGMIADGWGNRMRAGLYHISNADYDKGFVVFDEYIKAFPKEPGGYFFYAAGLKEQMQKNDDLSDIDKFFDYADKMKKICKRRLRLKKHDAVAKTYLGGINGYISMIEVKRRNLVTALFAAADAKSALVEANAEDPELPDVYFGLGMLYYFASLKSKKEGGMAGWIIKTLITDGEDLSEKGIALAQEGVDRNALGIDYALGALVWMRLYQKNYGEAKSLATMMQGRFPKDTSSRWVLGRIAIEDNDCPSARKWFEQVDMINKTWGNPDRDYMDTSMSLKMTSLCESIKAKRWGLASSLRSEVEQWLDDSPKAVIEYQEEGNLFAAWKHKLKEFRVIIKAANGG